MMDKERQRVGRTKTTNEIEKLHIKQPSYKPDLAPVKKKKTHHARHIKFL
jgi:hypothetical protein